MALVSRHLDSEPAGRGRHVEHDAFPDKGGAELRQFFNITEESGRAGHGVLILLPGGTSAARGTLLRE